MKNKITEPVSYTTIPVSDFSLIPKLGGNNLTVAVLSVTEVCS
ncbi:hypothetical protein [Photobacterium sp.]|nr:hypothetical protein [Photobacterium sp.]